MRMATYSPHKVILNILLGFLGLPPNDFAAPPKDSPHMAHKGVCVCMCMCVHLWGVMCMHVYISVDQLCVPMGSQVVCQAVCSLGSSDGIRNE